MTPASQALLARPGLLWSILQAVRLHQWSKNVLLFVPVIAAHRPLEPAACFHLLAAFFAFSFAASTGYLINDLIDVEADRRHRTKCLRPFASGALRPATGVLLACVLGLAAVLIGMSVSSRFLLMLLAYLGCSLLYSVRLKSVELLDVFVLAAFYTFRIYIGAEASATPVSFWLAAFSLFLFLALAYVKRYSELTVTGQAGERRGYRTGDAPQLSSAATASAYAATVVFALYIDSLQVQRIYNHPEYLWVLCVGLLFWVQRLCLLASRQELTGDPVLFALQDRVTWCLLAGGAFLLWLSS